MKPNNTRNLVICRAGDRSLHRFWLKPDETRKFDLWINYYGEQTEMFRQDGRVYKQSKGTKFPELSVFIHEHLDQLAEYDAIWLADDDILTNSTVIQRMFDIFQNYHLWLAQPSLSADSYYSYGITLQHRGLMLRYTNFVEAMAPLFSREVLLKLLPTFPESVSGWGLDFIWPKLLGYPEDKIAILDAVSVSHLRPVGKGELYCKLKSSPDNELDRIIKKYEIQMPFQTLIYQIIFSKKGATGLDSLA